MKRHNYLLAVSSSYHAICPPVFEVIFVIFRFGEMSQFWLRDYYLKKHYITETRKNAENLMNAGEMLPCQLKEEL